jgi:outer membrane protein OmpA-like peptidoglycan-associated protein
MPSSKLRIPLLRFLMSFAVLLALALTLATLSACTTPAAPTPKAVAAIKPSQVIPIQQLDRGVLILMPLDKVAFDFGKATITAVEAHEFLDRVGSILKDKTTARIALEGHTDNVGSRALNQGLSDERAASVRRELARRGVEDLRMTTAGFAFDKPAAPNDTEMGRKENRRVELIVLGETVANITKGEPEGSFEVAFSRLKSAVDAGAARPAKDN